MKLYELASLAEYDYHRALNADPEPGVYEPPTRCTYAQMVAGEADETLSALSALMFSRLADNDPDYLSLCHRAFGALYAGDPARAKEIGLECQAATEALHDMARDDVRALVLEATRAGVKTVRRMKVEVA